MIRDEHIGCVSDANSNRLTAIDKITSDTDLDGDYDNADFSKTTRQNLTIEETSNRLLGFTQTLTNVRGTRTVSTANTNVSYAVDAAGNLTSDGLRTFEYDASNRLSKARIFRDGEEASIRYLHNATGQRVFKGEPTASQTLPSEADLGTSFIDWLKKNFRWLYANAQANTSIGTAYVYGDGEIPSWALLGECDNGSAKGAGRSEFIWLPTEEGSAVPIGMFRNGKLFAIHADHLGTPRLMTNELKQPVWQWPYSAFGNNKPTGILKAAPNPRAALTNVPVLLKATGATEMGLRMPGQIDDPETGTFQNIWRSYWAAHGRYTQMDPIGMAGGWNRRLYAHGGPMTFADPLGLDVYLCRQPAFGWMPVDHQWLKTDSYESGMGGTRGNEPGNQYGDLPGDPVETTDHSGRSKQPDATCKKVEKVDEKTVDDLIKPGRPLGRWGPTNQCQSFVKSVLDMARRSSSGSVSK